MNKFDHLETLVRRFIEGTFDRLFQAQVHPADLAQQLTLAIEQSQQNGTRAQSHLIPNRYQIMLNPADYAALVSGANRNGDVEVTIRDHVAGLIREGGYQLAGSLELFLTESQAVGPGTVNIKIDDTPVVFGEAQSGPPPSNVASRWLLQFEERQFRLGEPVVRVGRALDNDIVLSDRTVSRYHAQLRWRNGAYQLYPPAPSMHGGAELGVRSLISDKGDAPTLVNQKPVAQTVLAPGDVVKLGNVVMTVMVEPENVND
ncbi:MAG TPA: FhaA domain-containing protein [Anaerolineae bacterium]